MIDKSKLPSRHVSLGAKSSPHRSYYYAMGLKEHEIYQPFIGVVSTWNESAPCNITLQDQAQHVKSGVKASGGTPREFTTITVTDGIAMGHEAMKSSLISREVILCDSSPVIRTTAIPLEPKGVEHATTVPMFFRRGKLPRSSLFVNYFLLSYLHYVKT